MENAFPCGEGRVVLALTEGGRGAEGKADLAIALRCLLVKLSIGTEVSPGLGRLCSAQDAGDLQVGWPQMPGVGRIEIEPEGGEVSKQGVIK